MRFFVILEKLKEEYADNCIVRKNGTILLGPGKIPKCRHMLFAPLSDAKIKKFLIAEYANHFPEPYIQFLKYTNGANLCMVKMNTSRHSFASSGLTIYGLPMTQPYSRPQDREEPYDVRVEDLGRHESVPNTWLKVGSYYDRSVKPHIMNEIFIDTETDQIHACPKLKADIVANWDSFDDCLCELYQTAIKNPIEYEFISPTKQ